jgi:membrane fusion protein
LCFGLALLAIVLFGKVEEQYQLEGRLVPSGGLLDIAAQSQGIVSAVLVEENEVVVEGQPLLEISSEVETQEGGGAQSQILVELKRQRDLLPEELAAQRDAHEEGLTALRGELARVSARLVLMEEEISLRRRQLGQAERSLERVSNVGVEGTVTELQLQQFRFQALNAEIQLRQVESQAIALNQDEAEPDTSAVLPFQKRACS